MKKLFIIDTDKLITTVYADFFVGKGYVVASSNTPFGVSAGIKVLDPDLVIVDMNLPGLSGNGPLNIINCNGAYKVVLISGKAQEDEMKTLTGSGQANDYFIKGEPLAKLGQKVSRLIDASNTDHSR
jgi:DNA-binding NtrC family response regulator